MSRNWSLALVVAFVLGYSLKVYVTKQEEISVERQQQTVAQVVRDPVFVGKGGVETHIFDSSDTRVRVVYFGYTRCPDVCPTSLAMLSAALNSISDEQLNKLRPMFISVDPERDDAKMADQYAHYFHPMIEGFSAPLDTTKLVAEHYSVVFIKTKLEDSAIDYVVDHSSYFYFLEPDGTLITKIPHTLEPTPIVTTITDILDRD